MQSMENYEYLLIKYSGVTKKLRPLINKMRKDRKSPAEVEKHLQELQNKQGSNACK